MPPPENADPLSPPQHTGFVRAGLTLLQIGLLAGLWFAADAISSHWLPQLPPGILGMLLLLAGFASGALPLHWFHRGARWLLAEMLLFFVPAVIAVVQYPAVVVHQGLAIACVIVVSTQIVMASTALAVDGVHRLRLLCRLRGWSARP